MQARTDTYRKRKYQEDKGNTFGEFAPGVDFSGSDTDDAGDGEG